MDVSTDVTPASPPRLSRRRFFTRLAQCASVPLVGGLYSTQVEPFWPEFHEISVSIPKLPKSFDGFRIAHLTDMHASDIVPFDYLERIVRSVNDLKPDL